MFHYLNLDVAEASMEHEGDLLPLKRLKELRRTFRPLLAVRGYGNQIRPCTAYVNPSVKFIEVLSSHVPCDHHALYVWPYCELPEGRVYSDPPYFRVGTSFERGFGYVPELDWIEPLRAAGISEAVITKVRDFLARHPAVPYDESSGGS